MASRLPTVLFGAAVLASGALLLSLATHLTFLGDSWELLVRRQGLSAAALLDPFHEHSIFATALVYKLLLATLGMDSAMPYFIVSIALFLAGVSLLYVYLRRRLGDWMALFCCLPILFLGAASEDLLWEFQMTFFGSVAAGLGMLLALDRESPRGDRLACLLLLASMAFSGVGLAFAAAAVVDLICGRRPRRSRAYVALLPLAVYLIWWIAWGSAEGGRGIPDPLQVPRDVFDGMAAGLASLLGRSPLGPDGHPPMGVQFLAAILFALAMARIWRGYPPSRSVLVALAGAAAFWGLIALDQGLTRQPTSSRYQFPSAVFVLLLGSGLVGRPPRSRSIFVAAAAVSAVSVAGGLSILRHEYDDLWRPTAEDTRATLSAADLAGESASPGRRLRLPVDAVELTVGEYVAARARYGSPAFSEAELLRLRNHASQFADRTMAEILGLDLVPAKVGKIGPRCQPPARTKEEIVMRPGLYEVRTDGDRVLRLRRFADNFPVEIDTLATDAGYLLAIPVDRAREPWRMATGGAPWLCGRDR